MRVFYISLILWLSLMAAGCQANAVETAPGPIHEPASTSIPVISTLGEPELTPSLPISTDAGLQDLIDKAIADLANRLSTPADEIILLEATPVVWPDASLGCPQPGMAYAQVPVDGLLIRLQAESTIYEYHSGGSTDPFLCVKTGKEPSPPPPIDLLNLTPGSPNATPGSAPTPDNSIPPGEDN